MKTESCAGCGGAVGSGAPGCSQCGAYLLGRDTYRSATRVVLGVLFAICCVLGLRPAAEHTDATASVAPIRTTGAVVMGVDDFHCNRSHGPGGPGRTALHLAETRGFTVRHLREPYTERSLQGLDVLMLGDSGADVDATDEEARHVERWVHQGGVFIVNPLIWVAESYGKKSAHSVNANVLTQRMGVFFSPKYLTSDVRLPGVQMKEYDMIVNRETMAGDEWLSGVQTLGLNGVPGQIEIEQGDVLIWASDRATNQTRQPWLVRVPYGKGLVVGFQHESLFGDDTLAGVSTPGKRQYDNMKLWENILAGVHRHRRP